MPYTPAPDQRVTVRNDDIPWGVDGNHCIGAGKQSGDGSFWSKTTGQHYDGGTAPHPDPVQYSLAFVADAIERFEENKITVGKLVWNQLIGGGNVDVHRLDVETGEQAENFLMGSLACMKQNNLCWR